MDFPICSIKILFEKVGGVRKYLKCIIPEIRKNEVNTKKLFRRPIPEQDIETPYGKCSKSTLSILSWWLLIPVRKIRERISAERKSSLFQVVEYLLENGWTLPTSGEVATLVEKHAPIKIFQLLAKKGFEIHKHPELIEEACKNSNIEFLRFIYAFPLFAISDGCPELVGETCARNHDYKNYRYFVEMGVKPSRSHLVAAIQNTEKFKASRENYLEFIKKLLNMGIDPNCMQEAKALRSKELLDLLLIYGAKPL